MVTGAEPDHYFIIEKSTNGFYFSSVDTIISIIGSDSYEYVDPVTLTQKTFYRLRYVQKDGRTVKVSHAVQLNHLTSRIPKIQVDASGKTIIVVNGAQVLMMRLINLNGVVIARSQNIQLFNIPSGKGLHVLEIKTVESRFTFNLIL